MATAKWISSSILTMPLPWRQGISTPWHDARTEENRAMTTDTVTSPEDYGMADISAAERRDGNVEPSFSRVNTDTTGDQDSPAVTALADGGWVVTWDSYTYHKKSGIYASNSRRDGFGNPPYRRKISAPARTTPDADRAAPAT